jgi:hypothetical protein
MSPNDLKQKVSMIFSTLDNMNVSRDRLTDDLKANLRNKPASERYRGALDRIVLVHQWLELIRNAPRLEKIAKSKF